MKKCKVSELSAVEPIFYRNRYQKFMTSQVFIRTLEVSSKISHNDSIRRRNSKLTLVGGNLTGLIQKANEIAEQNNNPVLALNSSIYHQEQDRPSLCSNGRNSIISEEEEDPAQAQFLAKRLGNKSELPRRDTKSNKLEVHAPFDYNPDQQYLHEEAEPFTP